MIPTKSNIRILIHFNKWPSYLLELPRCEKLRVHKKHEGGHLNLQIGNHHIIGAKNQQGRDGRSLLNNWREKLGLIRDSWLQWGYLGSVEQGGYHSENQVGGEIFYSSSGLPKFWGNLGIDNCLY